MRKSELLARIETLERRIAALEARPVVYHPQPAVMSPTYVSPTVAPPFQFGPPWTITCGGEPGTALANLDSSLFNGA